MELIKRRGTLVVVSAPSGAGKSTLCHEVRSLIPDLYYSVSYTTRAPRPGEVRGTDFHFVSEAEFIAMRNRDEFAEWAEVHGHLYGTPARALEGALGRGLDVLLDIEPSWKLACASATAIRRATSPGGSAAPRRRSRPGASTIT